MQGSSFLQAHVSTIMARLVLACEEMMQLHSLHSPGNTEQPYTLTARLSRTPNSGRLFTAFAISSLSMHVQTQRASTGRVLSLTIQGPVAVQSDQVGTAGVDVSFDRLPRRSIHAFRVAKKEEKKAHDLDILKGCVYPQASEPIFSPANETDLAAVHRPSPRFQPAPVSPERGFAHARDRTPPRIDPSQLSASA